MLTLRESTTAVRIPLPGWKVVVSGASVLVALLCAGCTQEKQDEPALRLDMSAEHDAGRFEPEAGERVGLTASLNGGSRDTLFLRDENGDWIYTLPLRTVAGQAAAPADSLSFAFFQAGGRADSTEEGPERTFSVGALSKRQPAFTYGEPFDARFSSQVTFSVDMRNQQTLGFFKPEAEDRVVVSGSFSDWREQGIPLRDEDGDGIYKITVPVKYRPGTPVEYKFRMLSKRLRAALPNEGWEKRPNRTLRLKPEQAEAKTPYAAFGDLRRTARFIVDAEAWKETGRFQPQRGDVLQVRLILDDDSTLTDPLYPVGDDRYETAVVIPMRAENVKWQVVTELGHTPLTGARPLEAPASGRLVRYRAVSEAS